MRAGLNFGPQLAQLQEHRCERIGHLAKLVVRRDPNRLIEVASRQPARGLGHLFDRRCDRTGEEDGQDLDEAEFEDEFDELEDSGEFEEFDELGMEGLFLPVTTLWHVLGAIDDDDCLTPLGWWGLPEAMRRVWAPSGGTPG